MQVHRSESECDAVLSYAGRVEAPRIQPIPTRTGGFGGIEGLVAYLVDLEVTHIIDATHPFAQQISRNAVAAAIRTGLPLIALTRPAWTSQDGDDWTHAPDMETAIHGLNVDAMRIFLAIGRTEIARFTALPQHHYVLRFVDTPKAPPPLSNHEVVVDRGPFDVASDRALLEHHRIDLVVSKNSGGEGARAKLDAARALGLPVLMIDRPSVPPRYEVSSVDDVMHWVAHGVTERGV